MIRLKKLSEKVGLDLIYFIEGGFWLSFATLASFFGGIVLSSLFARIWPQDVYGQFAFLTSALGFVGMTALPGMGQAITQAVAEGRDGVYKRAAKLVSKWSLLGMAILIAGSAYFYFRQNSNLALATFASALAFPISTTASFYNSFLTGKKLFKLVAIFTIIAQYSSLVATGVALLLLPTLFWVALFSAWSTAIVNAALTWITFSKIKNEQSDEEALKLGVHLSFSQIFSASSDYLDRLFVPLFLGFFNNAIYAFAVLIPVQIHSFLKIITSLSQPKLAEISNKQLSKDLWKKLILMEGVIFLIVGMYVASAPVIFDILYPKYKDSSVLLSQIFAIGLLYFPSNIFGLGLVKKRQSFSLYKVNFIYAVSTLISLLTLIPALGLMGAVMARVVGRFFQAGAQYYFFIKSFKR